MSAEKLPCGSLASWSIPASAADHHQQQEKPEPPSLLTLHRVLFSELKEEIELMHNDNHPVCLQKHFPTSSVGSVSKRVRFSRLRLVLTYTRILCLAQPGLVLRKVSVSYQNRQNNNKN